MKTALRRILEKVGDPDLVDRLTALPPSDLNTLLLAVFDRQVGDMTPSELLKHYGVNRFARPSGISATAYHTLALSLLSMAEAQGFIPVELSPVAPCGSCSVFGAADQKKVVSALRGCEVMADPTNMLALHIADGLKRGESMPDVGLHTCAVSRVTRAQIFGGPREFAHFGIFGLVSAGRDSGSYRCEGELLLRHLHLVRELAGQLYGDDISVLLRRRGGYRDGEGFFAAMCGRVDEALPGVDVWVDTAETDNAYYRGLNYKLYKGRGVSRIEIGDGGFVDWLAQLTGHKKARMLIGGLGMERLMGLME